jgi:SH3-like domain-containing protein
MAVTTQSFGARHRLLTAALGAAVAFLWLGAVSAAPTSDLLKEFANGPAKMPPAGQGKADVALGKGSVTGLPVPRFVSLKADRINVRAGPGRDQDVRWVYTRAGMPVEVIAEYGNWRRIRDWQGAEGWVYHSLLSGKRTAVVVPRLKSDLVPLYYSPDAKSAVVARLQGGVLGRLVSCTGTWCEFSGKGFDGWIMQVRLWGAYPNEKID